MVIKKLIIFNNTEKEKKIKIWRMYSEIFLKNSRQKNQRITTREKDKEKKRNVCIKLMQKFLLQSIREILKGS